jgi:WD40 repeat protein
VLAPAQATLAVLLVLGAVLTGAGLLALRPPQGQGAAVGEPPISSKEERNHLRRDRFGDPLPSGAVARLGTTRFRHGGRIYSLALSPDGRVLASRGLDGVVRLWDVSTAKELRSFPLSGSGRWTDTVALAPDGKLLAAATDLPGAAGSAVLVWDPVTGREVHRLTVKDGRVSAVVFAPGAGTLAGVTGAVVGLWDVAGGREIRRLRGHEGEIEVVAVSADGKTLATGGRDGTVRLWDLTAGAELRRLDGRLPLAPDVEIDLGGFKRKLQQRGVLSLAFSRDGRRLAAAASGAQTLCLWDTDTGRMRPPFEGDCREVTAVVFLPDGRTLLSGSWDGTIRLWDVAGRKEVRHFQGQSGPVLSLALCPDGRTLMVGGRRTIRLWDPARGEERRPLGAHHEGVYRVAFSPDGAAVASASGDGDEAVCLWDARTGAEGRRLKGGPGNADLLRFSRDGKTLTLGQGWQHPVRSWAAGTGEELRPRDHGTPCRFLPSPPGRLAGTDQQGALCVWDEATGALVRRLRVRWWSGGALSPDGALLACDSPERDGTFILWDVRTGAEVRRFQGYPRTLTALAFSPDGRYLVGSFNSAPRPLILWDVTSGARLAAFSDEGRPASCLAFSPDGKTLASGGWDGTVRLWEVVTAGERRCFRGHCGQVLSLAFSPGGNRLASGGRDTTGVVWDVLGREGAPLTAAQMQALWADLASADAARSYRAAGRLAGSPRQAVPFLAEHLRPAAPADPRRLARLIADLDSERFEVRDRAARELAELADAAEPALRRACEAGASLETRRRAEQLLGKLSLASPERLRLFRALEVVEHTGAPEARRLLADLAGGLPGALLTREARASLKRLDQAPPVP